MICTVWAPDAIPAGRDVPSPPARDLARLTGIEARAVLSLRRMFQDRHLGWVQAVHQRPGVREVLRNRIATIRALRFAIEVLS